jgi:threonylcarbamoyladenosine tRNA methylthiotransferase MtaB
MPKFKITTLGCKVNQYESEAIARQLEASDWGTTSADELPDLCIINTCTVTQKASMQSRQAVRLAVKANPGARIMVTGCYAQTAADELKKIEGVDHVIGHAEKHKIAAMILKKPIADEMPPIMVCADIRQMRQFGNFSETVYGSRTRPFLKIQDGCDALCTYCIVPYARGPSRSMPLKAVLDHIEQLAEAGYHEVVLTGVHLGNYGLDLDPKTSLYDLIRTINASNLIGRVRLSSIEPLELNNELIEFVAKSPMFCRHFHIPLQSGDDGILKKMNRPYTSNYFRDLVHKIRKNMPDAAMGADILVGFPGETREAFENTYNLILASPITYLHVFPFSSRPGTPAGKFPDKIPPEIIKKRCERMRLLGAEKRIGFYKRFVGQILDVLIEETRHRKSGLLKGISSNYIPVLIDGPATHMNTIVKVRIEKIYGNSALKGAVVAGA